MSARRSILYPGGRHLAAFIFISFILHVLWFVWYALQGAAMFAVEEEGVLGLGGGTELIFEMARGDDGGPQQEIYGEELDYRQDLPETLAEDVVEAPVVEDKMATPTAPAENKEEVSEAKPKPDNASGAEAKAGVKKQAGGEGGSDEESKRNRAGSALTGAQISSAAAGRTLNLLAGRLDIPGGNRLMNVKLDLFPDGMMRVQLTYFHYKTFHKLVPSTRKFKGDGKWWVENNSLCLRAMVIDYGTVNCYEMNQKPDGKLDLYFADCTGKSSSICRKYRLGATGQFSSGIE